MSEQPSQLPSQAKGRQSELANLLGVIERAGDLALSEEPSCFAAALDEAAAEAATEAKR
ncbi:MAG TPA: hypothetical protein VGR44_02245 [Methylomirabilota bacterium]|jgi:hypothetical protein|nr:hypothetical protein [Methylomirabilota bacterium]